MDGRKLNSREVLTEVCKLLSRDVDSVRFEFPDLPQSKKFRSSDGADIRATYWEALWLRLCGNEYLISVGNAANLRYSGFSFDCNLVVRSVNSYELFYYDNTRLSVCKILQSVDVPRDSLIISEGGILRYVHREPYFSHLDGLLNLANETIDTMESPVNPGGSNLYAAYYGLTLPGEIYRALSAYYLFA